MLQSINAKFYLVIFLLLCSFGLVYGLLAYSLHQQSLSNIQVNHAVESKHAISLVSENFHRARLLENAISNDSTPEAEKEFVYILHEITDHLETLRKKGQVFDESKFFKQTLEKLVQYESLVHSAAQLKTQENLLNTRLNSTFQSMSSTILREKDIDTLRSYFGITHFFLKYQKTKKSAQFKALRLVTQSLEKRILNQPDSDVRLSDYMRDFNDSLNRIFETQVKIEGHRRKIEVISEDLNLSFAAAVNEVEKFINDLIKDSENRYESLEAVVLAATISGVFLLLLIHYLLKKNIIGPVRLISQVMAEVQGGNRNARFETRLQRQDEIIDIGNALNRMLDTIEERDKTLEKQLKELSLHKEKEEALSQQLQRAEKMEAIGTLAGGVAHDLNNILSGVVNYPELILTEMDSDNPHREDLYEIKEAGMRAAAVVQDLLTLSRRSNAIFETTNLNRLIHAYLNSPEGKKYLADNPLVSLELSLSDNLFNIKGSPIHLQKTIMNLIINGLESIQGKGKLTITTENRYISEPIIGYDEVIEGDYAALIVEDTGKGIPAGDLAKIFEPFYTKKKMGKSGTGLGLAVVWGAIKDHNGYIDVHSSEDKGTVFTIYFPITFEEILEESALKSIESYKGEKQTVLVVDDIETQRKIASAMLTKLNYTVYTASSGEEALAQLEKNRVDMLLLDMLMPPGIDGLETYQNALEINPAQKAIIASGYSETERVQKAQQLGAAQYIRKPYSIDLLGNALQKAFGVNPLH